jgi:CRISPR/Cas system-associated exonuclease Cas4 (RecB family)
MKRYVERFGDYYGVTVYRLYPDQLMQEEYLGIGSTSYRKRLAELLRKEISWLSYQSKTLTSQELLSSPRIKYRDTKYKLSLPARIFDDLLICKVRCKYSIDKIKASSDPRMEYERKEGEITLGDRKRLELYFYAGDWIKIVGIPDSIINNLVFEFTISRQSVKHILGRAVIYAYMCMKENEYCSTMIVPTTPGEEIGYLVIPNSKFLEYLSDELRKTIEEEVEGKRIPFCKSCIYRNICPYS